MVEYPPILEGVKVKTVWYVADNDNDNNDDNNNNK